MDIESFHWYTVTFKEKKMRCSVSHPTLRADAEQNLLPPNGQIKKAGKPAKYNLRLI